MRLLHAPSLPGAWSVSRRARGSLTIKFALLIAIFVVLPFVLYDQFEAADRRIRDLLIGSIQHRSWLTAQALARSLDRPEGLAKFPIDNDTLGQYAEDGTTLKLLFSPRDGANSGSFYFIASHPRIAEQDIDSELDVLEKHGILESLAQSCVWGKTVEFRYDLPGGTEELLTSVNPINAAAGCWVLISSHGGAAFLKTSLGRPYWQADGIRFAIAIYLIFAVLAVLVVGRARRALDHFRTAAHEIRRAGPGHTTFSSRNIIPELATVATDFDQLVQDLHRTAADIRRTAEDNAHAVKTPVAVIRSAVERLKRSERRDDTEVHRAISLIESSVMRLTSLISVAQSLSNDAADFIVSPKVRVDIGVVVREALHTCQEIAAEKGVKFIPHLEGDICVLAPAGILDVVIENILDNATGFSPRGGKILVIVSRQQGNVNLYIEDEGPGIEPEAIDRVFDRYVSIRPRLPETDTLLTDLEHPAHAGLGLWIVRRYTEALGGRVTASNRAGGGLCVHLTLPCSAA